MRRERPRVVEVPIDRARRAAEQLRGGAVEGHRLTLGHRHRTTGIAIDRKRTLRTRTTRATRPEQMHRRRRIGRTATGIPDDRSDIEAVPGAKPNVAAIGGQPAGRRSTAVGDPQRPRRGREPTNARSRSGILGEVDRLAIPRDRDRTPVGVMRGGGPPPGTASGRLVSTKTSDAVPPRGIRYTDADWNGGSTRRRSG